MTVSNIIIKILAKEFLAKLNKDGNQVSLLNNGKGLYLYNVTTADNILKNKGYLTESHITALANFSLWQENGKNLEIRIADQVEASELQNFLNSNIRTTLPKNKLITMDIQKGICILEVDTKTVRAFAKKALIPTKDILKQDMAIIKANEFEDFKNWKKFEAPDGNSYPSQSAAMSSNEAKKIVGPLANRYHGFQFDIKPINKTKDSVIIATPIGKHTSHVETHAKKGFVEKIKDRFSKKKPDKDKPFSFATAYSQRENQGQGMFL